MHIVIMAPTNPSHETAELLKAAMRDIPEATLERVLSTLAAWAPKMSEIVTYRVTPEAQAALDDYDALMDDSEAHGYLDSGEMLETATALAAVLRPVQAAIEELFASCNDEADLAVALYVVLHAEHADATLIRKLHTATCLRNGWKPS